MENNLTTVAIVTNEADKTNVKNTGKGFDNSTHLPGAELLVTCSMGLYFWRGKYYMQVITADNYNNYIIEIPVKLALTINQRDNVEIEFVKDENTTTISL